MKFVDDDDDDDSNDNNKNDNSVCFVAVVNDIYWANCQLNLELQWQCFISVLCCVSQEATFII